MEHQLTLRLPAALAEKLERAARSLRRKRSEVARLALEQFLDAQVDVPPIERVRGLLGSVESCLQCCLVLVARSGLDEFTERPASYFLPFARGCWGRLWLSCLDFALAVLSALAASFCFWPRCFDLSDLSPIDTSIRWRKPSGRQWLARPQRASGWSA